MSGADLEHVSPFGVYDRAGGTQELVGDVYHDKWYANSPDDSRTGPAIATNTA